LAVTRQALAKAFRLHVGVSPKRFARIQRFHQLVCKADAASVPPQANWTEMALDAGYFDHSHLIKDFGDFARVTPAVFLKTRESGLHFSKFPHQD
jgi:methylphosphotriester-DNA--protein-cysteine methyltransferase